MSLKLRNDTYIDWTVYSVTKIKEKYGFRIHGVQMLMQGGIIDGR